MICNEHLTAAAGLVGSATTITEVVTKCFKIEDKNVKRFVALGVSTILGVATRLWTPFLDGLNVFSTIILIFIVSGGSGLAANFILHPATKLGCWLLSKWIAWRTKK